MSAVASPAGSVRIRVCAQTGCTASANPLANPPARKSRRDQDGFAPVRERISSRITSLMWLSLPRLRPPRRVPASDLNGLAPAALEESLAEGLAGARRELLLLRLLVEHVGARLIADRDHRHRHAFGGNGEGRARLLGVVARHLVRDQPERHGL